MAKNFQILNNSEGATPIDHIHGILLLPTEKSRIKKPKQITLRTCLRKIFQMFEKNYKLFEVI